MTGSYMREVYSILEPWTPQDNYHTTIGSGIATVDMKGSLLGKLHDLGIQGETTKHVALEALRQIKSETSTLYLITSDLFLATVTTLGAVAGIALILANSIALTTLGIAVVAATFIAGKFCYDLHQIEERDNKESLSKIQDRIRDQAAQHIYELEHFRSCKRVHIHALNNELTEEGKALEPLPYSLASSCAVASCHLADA